MGGDGRSPEEHYPTLDTEAICNLPIKQIAADDAVIYLWSTATHLLHAFKVLEAWGFAYWCHAIWEKNQIALGYACFRYQHELLLVGKRGDIPAPLTGNRVSSIIKAPRREHSQKPDEVYDLIERQFPGLPKIELFARNSRAGWDAWGNQAPNEDLTIPGFLRREATP